MGDIILTLEGINGNWDIVRKTIKKKIPALFDDSENIANILYHYVCCLIHEAELEDALVIAAIGIEFCKTKKMKEFYLNRIDDIEDLMRLYFNDESCDIYNILNSIEIQDICRKHNIPEQIWTTDCLKEQILSA